MHKLNGIGTDESRPNVVIRMPGRENPMNTCRWSWTRDVLGPVAVFVPVMVSVVGSSSESLAARAPVSEVGSTCMTASDCPLPGAPCELCADGTTACPTVSCIENQCVYQFQACPNVCDPGLVWCSLNARCVAPSCLACCQFGTPCSTAVDCANACVTCTDGSVSCSTGQCGYELQGQCFYPEPVCPRSKPVPAVPRGLFFVAAMAMGLLGIRAVKTRMASSDATRRS